MAESSCLSSATQRYKHSSYGVHSFTKEKEESKDFDQIREINRGKQTSNYPPAVAFEIYLAKPNIINSNFSHPRHFQRSSKNQSSNTAVKATQP